MTTDVLYRKYRPQKFSEVEGQDHVVTVLEKAVKMGNIGHAYLFTGTRGTGKTTIARILARAVGTSPNDLYEMDAASNRGIDDVRQLREGVATLPFESKYKVYIIDEAHMLTKEAFNALLKTLEEPPSHVIFILATTELEKVPETIVSRCQVFQFKKPSQKRLSEMVLSIAKKEGFSMERSSAELIALLGDGSFRDTQSILQKVLSSSGDKKISADEVVGVVGAPRLQIVNDLVSALDEKDLGKALEALRESGNVDAKVFLKLLIHTMRQLLLLRHAPGTAKVLAEEISPEQFSFLEDISKHKGSGISSATLVALLSAYETVPWAAIPSLPLELALIDLLAPKA